MAGLVPAIHASPCCPGVDARHKLALGPAGHDSSQGCVSQLKNAGSIARKGAVLESTGQHFCPVTPQAPSGIFCGSALPNTLELFRLVRCGETGRSDAAVSGFLQWESWKGSINPLSGVIMRTRFTHIALLTILLVFPGIAKAAPFYIGSSPLVPPTDGVYVSPADVHAQYDVGGVPVILRDIRHGSFTNIVRTPSLVPLGTNETFDSIVFGNVSIGGGPFMPISLAGPVQVFLFGYNTGDIGTFNTEMLALSLTGIVGGFPVTIRESPTQQSTGITRIQDLGSGGPYRIDSFFDVFTEITLDGGNNWSPSLGPTRVDLSNIPLPATWLMFLSGLGLLGFVRRRKSPVAA